MSIDTGTIKDPLWKRVLLFIAGIVSMQGFSYAFDYGVYPVVTYRYGLPKSLIILTIAAFILNWVLILVYDLFNKDFFGFDEIKKIKENAQHGRKKGLLYKIISWGDIPAFIALSFYDPFLATLYKRRLGTTGLKARDYFILALSTVIACVLWSGLWSPITLLK